MWAVIWVTLPIAKSITDVVRPAIGRVFYPDQPLVLPPQEVEQPLVLPEGVSGPKNLCMWISNNIRYDSVYKNSSTVQKPGVTLAKGSGVCFDDAVLMVALARVARYQEMWMLEFEIPGGKVNHVVVTDGKTIYDPTYGHIYENQPPEWRLIGRIVARN